MTAAGTVAPAKVLVLGAGVAGLQAIATARRLGAVVSGFDVRPAVREQVESLGASFLDLGIQGAETSGGYAAELTPEEQARQQAALEEQIPEFDVVVTTALVPGRPAPKLIPAAAVEKMRPGSVIVDLAAETGGTQLTGPGSGSGARAASTPSHHPCRFPPRAPVPQSQLLFPTRHGALLRLPGERAPAAPAAAAAESRGEASLCAPVHWVTGSWS
jgi:NAD(P) transhydrogenase subunit alpha